MRPCSPAVWPQQAFLLTICSPVGPLLDTKVLLPPKWTQCPCETTSRSGQSGCFHSGLPFCGSAPGGASCSRLPSPGRFSCPRLALPCSGVSCTCPALPYYAVGSNASGFAAAAFSAPLACSMLVVPLARPPPTGNAPPSSCASTPTDLAASTSVFTAVLASPRGSGSSWSSLQARLPGAGPHGGHRPHNGNASGSIHQPYYLLRCMRPNVPKITQTF